MADEVEAGPRREVANEGAELLGELLDAWAGRVRHGGGVDAAVLAEGAAEGAEDAGGREQAVEEDDDIVAVGGSLG
jgi:hypothetical protein